MKFTYKLFLGWLRTTTKYIQDTRIAKKCQYSMEQVICSGLMVFQLRHRSLRSFCLENKGQQLICDPKRIIRNLWTICEKVEAFHINMSALADVILGKKFAASITAKVANGKTNIQIFLEYFASSNPPRTKLVRVKDRLL